MKNPHYHKDSRIESLIRMRNTTDEARQDHLRGFAAGIIKEDERNAVE